MKSSRLLQAPRGARCVQNGLVSLLRSFSSFRAFHKKMDDLPKKKIHEPSHLGNIYFIGSAPTKRKAARNSMLSKWISGLKFGVA
jgi:hypothetical protein